MLICWLAASWRQKCRCCLVGAHLVLPPIWFSTFTFFSVEPNFVRLLVLAISSVLLYGRYRKDVLCVVFIIFIHIYSNHIILNWGWKQMKKFSHCSDSFGKQLHFCFVFSTFVFLFQKYVLLFNDAIFAIRQRSALFRSSVIPQFTTSYSARSAF